ncbi:MAG: macro domain-containing protein [Bacillota bacterium]
MITQGYALNARHVIHVVGPVYKDGKQNEETLLYETYQNALRLAKENRMESIAFPLIASGTFRFPRGKALEIALDAINEFLFNSDMMVYLVVYDEPSYLLSLDRFIGVKNYIENKQVSETALEDQTFFSKASSDYSKAPSQKDRKLEDLIKHRDDTFAKSLFYHIDEKTLDDVTVYKKANIDRKLFSKIKSDLSSQPSKKTAIAFAIALELNLDETKNLLKKAGYALSKSSTFDLIIQYFIEEGNYDLFEINQVLFTFDQKTLGV